METSATQQECAPMEDAQKEHDWLQKLVGEWAVEGEGETESGAVEPLKGTESVRSIGGLWVVAEGQGEMPGGGEAQMITTLGYDPRKQAYVGTFIASMMTYMWVYEGSLDTAEKALTLNTIGPRMDEEGEMAQFKDVFEFQDDDHRTLTAYMLDDEGKWQQLMKANYRREK